MDWTGGLRWHEPLEITDDETDEVAAMVEAMAGVINDAERQVQRAAGNWYPDATGILDVLVERALRRFTEEPVLTCAHFDHPTYSTYFASAVLAGVCDRPECLSALDSVIDGAERWHHCCVCADRSAWLNVTLAVIPVASGKLLSHVHTNHVHGDLAGPPAR